jgi:hypothetical protein
VVVNNKLIECIETQVDILYPDRIIELLIELYSIVKYRDKLPSVLLKHFEEPTNSFSVKCLTGVDDDPAPRVYMCLELELDTNCKNSNRVLLKNISFDRNPINREIRLNVRDFFFILSNLSVEFLAKRQIPLNEIKEDIAQLKENVNIPKITIKLLDFAFDYLIYIKDELIEGNLKPEEILQNGGINTLIFLKEEESVFNYIKENLEKIQSGLDYSTNEKLVLFSFFECLRKYEEIHSYELFELYARREEYRKLEEKTFYPKQFLIEREKILSNLEPRRFYFNAVEILRRQLNEEFPKGFK